MPSGASFAIGTGCLTCCAGAATNECLTWAPDAAEVSASGDLGYTIGTYRRTAGGKTGTGSYVTIWKKSSDGAWRVAVDIGTPPSPVSDSK